MFYIERPARRTATKREGKNERVVISACEPLTAGQNFKRDRDLRRTKLPLILRTQKQGRSSRMRNISCECFAQSAQSDTRLNVCTKIRAVEC